MEIIQADPDTVKSYWLPFREVRIMPLGDIQYGAPIDMERLKKYLKWAKQHDVWFLGMGDYLDVASPSNRKEMGGVRPRIYDSIRKAIDEKMTESSPSPAMVDEIVRVQSHRPRVAILSLARMKEFVNSPTR